MDVSFSSCVHLVLIAVPFAPGFFMHYQPFLCVGKIVELLVGAQTRYTYTSGS